MEGSGQEDRHRTPLRMGHRIAAQRRELPPESQYAEIQGDEQER